MSRQAFLLVDSLALPASGKNELFLNVLALAGWH
jgi:hypothetical protein